MLKTLNKREAQDQNTTKRKARKQTKHKTQNTFLDKQNTNNSQTRITHQVSF